MTPEEAETRLEALQTPLPPERLRERCLSPRRRALPPAAFAAAAALVIVPVVLWFIVTAPPTEVDRPARPATPKESVHDGELRKRIDGLLRKNPGKTVLVVRVNELRDGEIRPVTEGLRMRMMVEDAATEPDPLKIPPTIEANVDAGGALLFVIDRGKYRGVGFHNFLDQRLKQLSFIWEYKNFDADLTGVVWLADALFAPWMEWITPAAGSTFDLKDKLMVSWKAYPEVKLVKLDLERKQKFPDGTMNVSSLGALTLEAPQDIAFALAQVRSTSPFDPGDSILLKLTGYDASRREITGSRDKLEILFKE